MQSREDLERWIAGTRGTQRKLRTGVITALAISFVLLFVNRAVGGIGIAISAFVALAGFWITAGHINDWQDRLYKLDHPETTRPRSGRRYQSD